MEILRTHFFTCTQVALNSSLARNIVSGLSKVFGSILNDQPHNAFVKDDISYKHISDRGRGVRWFEQYPKENETFLLISSLRAQSFFCFVAFSAFEIKGSQRILWTIVSLCPMFTTQRTNLNKVLILLLLSFFQLRGQAVSGPVGGFWRISSSDNGECGVGWSWSRPELNFCSAPSSL